MKEILEDDGTIYEIIMAARDRLSEMNSSPDGECAICLCCFDNLMGLYKVFFIPKIALLRFQFFNFS